MQDVAQKSGYTIRWDKGPFHSGSCTHAGDKLIVLNRHHPIEVHLGVMARTLKDVSFESISMRKEMRTRIEEIVLQYSSE